MAEGFVLKKGVASVQIDAKRVVARLEIVVNDHEKSSNVWPLTALTKIVQIYVFNRAPDSRFLADEMLTAIVSSHGS